MDKLYKNIPLDKAIFQKFRKLYLFAFLGIAISIIFSHFLIQRHIDRQLNDSRIVNIAGRQRMLSQKITKLILELSIEDSLKIRVEKIDELKETFNLWSESHEALQAGSESLKLPVEKNKEIIDMFKKVDKYYIPMKESVTNILTKLDEDGHRVNILNENDFRVILGMEKDFLVYMDGIVFKYDEISQLKLKQLKFLETLLLAVSLVILFLEIAFLFRPMSFKIRDIINELNEAREQAISKAEVLQEMYESKEESLQELQGLNYALDNAALFVNVATDGTVLHISKKFTKLLGLEKTNTNLPLEELLTINEVEQHAIIALEIGIRRGIWIGEIEVTSRLKEKLSLEISIIPMNKVRNDERVLILCTDITKRILTQREIVRLNEERFNREVNQQKEQASQIVEAQEEERKRIAKDIHDGIGQMLTALKFNIESIKSEDIESTMIKVNKLKELLGSLIREVRAVTFNLTPPELHDYGIGATLSKLSSQLSHLTEKNVFFENKTNFTGRFESLVETNLYRVVQEAVNNALKYSNSNFILISLSHSKTMLSINVVDDGVGFDLKKVENSKKNSGMGLFFMKERIRYINGRIFINSEKQKGTRITININLESA